MASASFALLPQALHRILSISSVSKAHYLLETQNICDVCR